MSARKLLIREVVHRLFLSDVTDIIISVIIMSYHRIITLLIFSNIYMVYRINIITTD